jgi:hypothetical protein
VQVRCRPACAYFLCVMLSKVCFSFPTTTTPIPSEHTHLSYLRTELNVWALMKGVPEFSWSLYKTRWGKFSENWQYTAKWWLLFKTKNLKNDVYIVQYDCLNTCFVLFLPCSFGLLTSSLLHTAILFLCCSLFLIYHLHLQPFIKYRNISSEDCFIQPVAPRAPQFFKCIFPLEPLLKWGWTSFPNPWQHHDQDS